MSKLSRDMDDAEFLEMIDDDLQHQLEKEYGFTQVLGTAEEEKSEAGREKRYSEDEKEKEQENKTSPFREFLSWAMTFIIALAAAILIKEFLIINANVPSGSMENTIMPGDRLFGNRLAYINSDPERGDIIIFKYPDNEKEIYVKRIIGLPGETITITDAQVYIDGSTVPLPEDYLKEEWKVATGPYTFEVPEGCYFVMGDNRNDSWDARYWTNTYVAKEKILGEAVFTYWPFEDWGKLE